MQKKRVVLVLIMTLLVLAGIGGTKKVVEMRQEAQKERQIAFLKAHEKEMTSYIKAQNPRIKTVQYNWNSVEVETKGNGTPMGAGKALTIDGKFNNIYNSSFYLQFAIDEKSNLPVIENMTSFNSFRVGGELYE
ncbi:hypothetical protein [Ligilactobacillus animalis]|uniref:hypothetical protein n=1 Tax=Ligilactobacillus animalis TaxID=1605 RepID=UPI000824CD0A|nr:hypothetical protein [Ligilactobacillus animalis]OCX47514.1 hypothetical protein BFC98_08125 [Ligilactobacillus animalis]